MVVHAAVPTQVGSTSAFLDSQHQPGPAGLCKFALLTFSIHNTTYGFWVGMLEVLEDRPTGRWVPVPLLLSGTLHKMHQQHIPWKTLQLKDTRLTLGPLHASHPPKHAADLCLEAVALHALREPHRTLSGG